MNRTTPQTKNGARCWRRLGAFLVACATVVAASLPPAAHAGDAADYKPTRAQGGLSPRPAITSMTLTTNKQVTVKWTGFGGPYQVLKCPALDTNAANWKVVASATNTATTLPLESTLGFLRVTSTKDPNYAGAATCQLCHTDTHATWTKTVHAGAFDTLKGIKQDKNQSCLPCHTVGAGFATGFKDEATTPGLAGVQCENCHGPAGDHARKPLVKSLRPVKTLAGALCGGCHTDAHHPTYEEWETSLHGEVNGHVAGYFKLPSPTGEARMLACGACHSGAVRMAMLTAYTNGDPVELPSGRDAASTGITCAVCHNPHEKSNDFQLRNPTHSMQAFNYNTATNTSFAAQYDPTVSVCGQCHNGRGATWKDTGRAPHHSPQYNMLTGTLGFLVGTNAPRQSSHPVQVSDQCAWCHVQSHPVSTPTEANPNYAGHTFKARFDNCQPCHIDMADAAAKVESTQADIKKRIGDVKALLDQWATAMSDSALRKKYGALAWEYNTIGDITDPPQVMGTKGPTTSEQNAVPDEIKQARFNLYLVAHDGSYGVHNAKYAQDLLKIAGDLVKAKLTPPAAKPASVGSTASVTTEN